MVTRKVIAERTGVSLTVVSHVLNHTATARVSPKTREKVLLAARELGYVANALGRALVEKRIRQIGVGISCRAEMDLVSREILNGMTTAAETHGYHLLLCPLRSRLEENIAEDLAALAASRRIDGLILNKEEVLTAEVRKLHARKLPFVLINNIRDNLIPGNIPVPSVGLDLAGGTMLAVQQLLSGGHRRIALFRTENGVFPFENHRNTDIAREEGFRQAMAAAELEVRPEWIPVGDFSRPGDIENALARLLALPEPPTAAIAASDLIAMKICSYLKMYAMRLPRDFSIIGGGNHFFCDHLEPALSSLQLPLPLMGELAVEKLIRLLDGKTADAPVITMLPVTLRRRESDAAIGVCG